MKKHLAKIKSKQFLKIAGGVILILLVLAGIFYYLKTKDRVSIDNSLISSPITTISPTSSGILKEVDVTEGQIVHKGEILAVVGSEILSAYTQGVIVMTDKQIGSSVTALTPIVELIDQTNMRVDGTLDENKGLNQVNVGQPISFTVDALPGQIFWGYIDEIAPTAKQTAVAFNISSERPTQQFDVFAHFDASSHPEIKNGMSAKMIVYTKSE